jgi:hypothetical protein
MFQFSIAFLEEAMPRVSYHANLERLAQLPRLSDRELKHPIAVILRCPIINSALRAKPHSGRISLQSFAKRCASAIGCFNSLSLKRGN